MPKPSVKISTPESVGTPWTTRAIQAAVVIAVVAVLWLWYSGPSRQMQTVRAMQQELFSAPRDALPPEERKEKFEALRAERDKLSDEEKRDLRKEMGEQFLAKRNAEAVAYLHMTPAERRKVVDERIAREQEWQKKFAAAENARPAGAPGPNNANPGGGPGGPGGGPGGPGNGPGGPGRKSSSPEDRDNRRREFLLNTSPEARAGMDQMRLDMAVRRTQLGLPPTSDRPRRR